MVGEGGLRGRWIDRRADVWVDKVDGGFGIRKMGVKSEVGVGGIDGCRFEGIMEKGKGGWGVCEVVKGEIRVD